jgi:DNA replication ATP-dependent helicase Dna2
MTGFHRRCHGTDNENPTVCGGGTDCWLQTVLDEGQSVVFIDTDEVPALEVRVGQSTQNPTEALLVCQIVEALTSGGIAESDIGVISVLRAQLKVLSRLLASRPSLDIHTVDRYQGKDKECVIVSLVRSNVERHVGELLKDWRRINVAFTRAKKKLIVLGSRQTLQGSEVFEQFLQLMERQDWVLRLPPSAQHLHPTLARPSPSFHAIIDSKEDKENINSSGEEEQAGTDKGPKVQRASAETLLRKMPTVKAILNSL